MCKSQKRQDRKRATPWHFAAAAAILFQTAMVTFNAAAMEQWNLGAHADSAALMASINALMRPGGLTNPGAAMQYVVDNVLGSAGDRCA